MYSRRTPAPSRGAKIVLQITDQTRAVRVVPENRAVSEPFQRVDRSGLLRPHAQGVAQFEGGLLEWQGDVGAAAALCEEVHQALGEAIGAWVNSLVEDVFTGLLGEVVMDVRRAAVVHRVTEDGIKIGHGIGLYSVLSHSAARRAK
jgi:hypothetical protein